MPSLYCTRDQLKARLGVADTRDDDLLDDTIESVSRMIDAECGTRFYAAEETRYFTARDYYTVLIEDLLHVSELATDSGGDGTFATVWAAADYVLAPYNAQANGRPYWKIERALNGQHTFTWVPRSIRVLGTWGYSSTVPKIVEAVCLREALFQFQANTTPYGMAAGDGAVSAPPSIAISNQSRLMLAAFKRAVVA